MNEVAGALERPADSRIEIVEAPDGSSVTVRIPRPRMPVVFYVAAAIPCLSLVTLFTAGFMVFILGRPFPGYGIVIGDFHPLPAFWRVIGGLSWLSIGTLAVLTIDTLLRPLVRTEEVVFQPGGLRHTETAFRRHVATDYSYYDALAFHDRRAMQGMVSSNLVLVLDRPRPSDGETEIPVCQSTTEAEKQWLTSALNVLLARYRRRV